MSDVGSQTDVVLAVCLDVLQIAFIKEDVMVHAIWRIMEVGRLAMVEKDVTPWNSIEL